MTSGGGESRDKREIENGDGDFSPEEEGKMVLLVLL